MDRPLRQLVRSLLALTLISGFVGCQCTSLYEPYGDLIDNVSDCPPRLDGLYSPCWDLTRIGKPDWCQCRFSHLLCGNRCCECNRRQLELAAMCYEIEQPGTHAGDQLPAYDDADVPTYPQTPHELVPPPPD